MDLMFKNISEIQKALGVGYLELFLSIVCLSYFAFVYKYFSSKLREKDEEKKAKEHEQLTLLIDLHNLITKDRSDDEIITNCQKAIGTCSNKLEYYSFQLMVGEKELDKEYLLKIVRNDLIKIRNLNINPDSLISDVNNTISYVRPLILPILPSLLFFYLTLLGLYSIGFILEGEWNWVIVVLGVLIVLGLFYFSLFMVTKVKKIILRRV
ncbi:hypothetical protein MKY22_01905 [Exiguobacterium sp. FSL W8-0210]|uniref:hypothetical protein n=1 Tax=Exiguobacterium sp. FSL W8-0210 TaxID=2921598 RepID=UPI0030FA8F5D